MKTISISTFLFSFLLSCFVSAQDSPKLVWASHFNSADYCTGNSVVTDASGNVYTTGLFRGTVDFNPDPVAEFKLTSDGAGDIFVSMTDKSGRFIWARQMGGKANEEGLSLSVDEKGFVYTTGFFEGIADFDPGTASFPLTSAGKRSVFISKLGQKGEFIWARQFGMEQEYGEGTGYGVVADPAGGINITGNFSGKVDVDPSVERKFLTSKGGTDIFIARLDESGNLIWAQGIGGTLTDAGNAITTDSKGNLYVTGAYSGTVVFDVNTGGSVLNSEKETQDIFVLKLGEKGNLIWAVSMGGPVAGTLAEEGKSIAADDLQNVLITGYFTGTSDFNPGTALFNLTSKGGKDVFISKLDSKGQFVWAKSLGAQGSDEGMGICQDSKGNIYTTGYFQNTVDFDPDPRQVREITSEQGDNVFILKLNSNGEYTWATGIGSNGNRGLSVTADQDLSVITTGYFSGKADFDPAATIYALTAAGGSNAFIQKLQSSANSVIVSQPVSSAICQDMTASFFVGSNDKLASYQWQRFNTAANAFQNLSNANGYNGVTTSTLLVNSKGNPSAAGQYRCIIKDQYLTQFVSETAALTVSAYPDNQTKVIGDTACYTDDRAYVRIPSTVSGYIYTAYYTAPQGVISSSSVAGDGKGIIIPLITSNLGIGEKKIIVKEKFNTCETQLKDSATVLVYNNPGNNVEVRGSVVCEGKDSASVSLIRTQTGISYQAFYNGSPLSKPVSGTARIDVLTFTVRLWSDAIYPIQVKASNAGCSLILPDTSNVTVKPMPDIKVSSNSPVCIGSPVVLQATNSTANKYEWKGPNNYSSFTAIPPAFAAFASSAGLYTLNTTGSNGCTVQNSISLSVKSIGSVSFLSKNEPVCQGEKRAYAVTSLKEATYTWSFKGKVPEIKSVHDTAYIRYPVNAVSDTLIITAYLNGCQSTVKLGVMVNPSPATLLSKDSIKACTGDSVTLSARLPRITYNWTGPDNFASARQTVKVLPPVAANKYLYIVRLSQGSCSGDADTTVVSIIAKPNAMFSYPATNFCQGNNEARPLKVPPGSLFTSVPSGLIISRDSGTVNFSRSKPGLYTISNTVTINGCTDVYSVKLNFYNKPQAVVITGACQNVTFPLLSVTGKPAEPSTVSWFRNNVLLAKSDTITARLPGIYKAIVTISASGCYSDTASVDPFIKKPAISILSGSKDFCMGDSVRLVSNSSAGNTWRDTINRLPLAATQTLLVKKSGKIYLDVSNGSCLGRDSIIIRVKNNPQPGYIYSNLTGDSICPGASILLFNYNYSSTLNNQWLKDGIPVRDSVKATYRVSGAGSYQVQTTGNGCSSFSNIYSVKIRKTTVPLLDYKGLKTICQNEVFPVSIVNYAAGQDKWYINNVQVTDNNGMARIYPATVARWHKVIRTNAAGCKTVSDSVLLTVNRAPVVRIKQSVNTICPGGKVLYTVADTGVGPDAVFYWYVNKKLVHAGTGKNLLVDTLKKTSNIKVSALSSLMCQKPVTVSDSVTVAVIRSPAIRAVVTQPTCFNKNGVISLALAESNYKITGGNLKFFSNSSLDEGVYSISVLDTVNFCKMDTSFTLVSAGKFSYSKVILHPDCNLNNGSLNILPAGNYRITGDTIKSFFTQNLEAKKYRFNISSGNCSKNDTAILVAKAPFRLKATVVQPTCNSAGSLNLSIVPDNLFSVSGDLRSAGNSNLKAGDYAVRITENQSQCFKDTVLSLINPNAFVTRLKERLITVCQGTPGKVKPEYTNLSDTLPYTFSWMVKGKEVSVSSSPVLTDTGQYFVIVKNKATGCAFKDSLIYRTNPSPVVNAGKDTIVCRSDNVLIKAGILDVSETGFWSGTGNLVITTPSLSRTFVSNLSSYDPAAGNEANVLIWTVRNTISNCITSDTVKVYYANRIFSVKDIASGLAGDPIDARILLNDRFSSGDKLKVTLGSYNKAVSPIDTAYIIGDSVVRFITKPTILNQDSVTYSLSNNCGASGTARVIVLPGNSPPRNLIRTLIIPQGLVFSSTISISELDRNENVKPSTITFIRSTSGIQPVWEFTGDNKGITFSMNYSQYPDFSGTDSVQLRVCDDRISCSDLIFINKISGIKIYNALSPNGDGKNDYFIIDGIYENDQVSVQIFNRWGDKVYSEADYDGINKKFTGDHLPDGTYYYIVDINKGSELKEGFIILKR